MSWLDVVILSVVEGLTEFLPISSTGHLIIVSRLLDIVPSTFSTSFNIVVQLGAILAVASLYGRRLKETSGLLPKILIAFLPTAIVGLAAYSALKNYLLHNLALTIFTLGAGGILIILFERWYKRHSNMSANFSELSYKQAFWLGLAQATAIIPGVSRAGATIIAGLYMGLPRVAVVEFSFLLAIPTMLAASGYDLYKSAGSFVLTDWPLLIVGFIVSYLTAWLTVKWLLRFIKTHDFTAFGIYRVLLAVVLWWLLLG